MEKEEKFLNAAKRVLDDAEKNLDAGTVARLRAARPSSKACAGQRVCVRAGCCR